MARTMVLSWMSPNGDPLPDVTFTVYKVNNDTATTEIPTGP